MRNNVWSNPYLKGYTISATVATAGTPVRLVQSAGQYLCSWCLIFGKKGPRVDNAGSVYVGTNDGDGTANGSAGGKQPFHIPAGAERLFPVNPNGLLDLYDLWLDADNSGDGAIVFYY